MVINVRALPGTKVCILVRLDTRVLNRSVRSVFSLSSVFKAGEGILHILVEEEKFDCLSTLKQLNANLSLQDKVSQKRKHSARINILEVLTKVSGSALV